MTGPLLVIAHEATRTGAPRVLLELLRWARGELPAPVAVRLLAQGPLAGEFEAVAETADIGDTPVAVMCNGASAAGELLSFDKSIPALAYVHEEGRALHVLPRDCVTALRERCDRVLCVSTRAAADLADIGVTRSAVSILPPVVTEPPTHTDPGVWRTLGLGSGDPASPLVLGCGEAGWRKGADLFIDVARRVRLARSARFAWVGRRPRAFARLLDNDTSTMGLGEDLVWLGEIPEVGGLFEAAALLVMTSREDPQPLVPLEAAGFGTATVGFETGGLIDLANHGAAVTVPYPDTIELTSRVVALLDQPSSRAQLASNALEHRNRNHSIDILGPRFITEIRDLMAETER